MKQKIALFGAGGKMGVRLAKNLQKSDYRVAHVEVSQVGQQRLKDELGVECVSIDAALDNVDVVILAVPDTLIGKIAAEISPKLPAGVMVMTLEAAFDLGEDIAKVIYAPILRSYRLTVEQMALLEPGLSETVCATLLAVMREAMDETVRRGVPKEAARDFLLGHLNILGAVIFNELPGACSAACNKAIQFGKPRLMRDDWLTVFEHEEIAESIRRIT